MKHIIALIIVLSIGFNNVFAQEFRMPKTGALTITACHGYICDSGGTSPGVSTYSNNENGMITVCPDIAGQSMCLTLYNTSLIII